MAITGQGFSSRFSLPFFSTVDGGFFRAPPCNFTHGLHQDIQHVPSGYVKIAIENYHRNSWFTHWSWWCSIATLVYQRVPGSVGHSGLNMFQRGHFFIVVAVCLDDTWDSLTVCQRGKAMQYDLITGYATLELPTIHHTIAIYSPIYPLVLPSIYSLHLITLW